MTPPTLTILLVGNGGREHALAWRLAQSPSVSQIYVAPGNGGTASGSISKVQNVDISASNFAELVQFAQSNNVNLVVPGPEQPLVDGISKWFKKVGIPVFGPSEKAAVMEGSKTFSKDFMAKHNIPTAAFQNFTDYEAAKKYIDSVDHNVVIKASGLAAGKGVLIPETKQQAHDALKEVMLDKAFGSAGDEIVIEEFLEGDELSILALSDGYTVVDLPPAQDHKRIGENDTGLNTGGMGTYAPAPLATPALLQQIRETVLQPTIDGMRKDGFPFVGVLFVGIMLSKQGVPKVLEYNVRFGDPETQSVLMLLSKDTDLAQVFLACAEGRLDSVKVGVEEGYAATVVMSAGGYPESYEKGDEITIGKIEDNNYIFHAGTAVNKEGKLVTAGGRVIASSARAQTLEGALQLAYKGVDQVNFKGKYFRKDIGHRGLRDIKAMNEKDGSKEGITYASAGVNVDEGNRFVEEIKASVRSTRRSGADAEIGGFGGLFDLKAAGYSSDALLVGATDGVGTKLIIAQSTNIHDTVGIDLVAMSVNDLIVQGAEPLFFLDYYASGKLDIKNAASFVKGVAEGCIQSNCALIGGETAEMPGLYSGNDYDCNGTCVGAVERNQILPRLDEFEAGDVVLGLGSSGFHSNGFSLVRKIVEHAGLEYSDTAPWDTSKTVGESLLTPTRIYVKSLMSVIKKDSSLILGLANITGGGLTENVPRVLPKHLNAVVDVTSYPLPTLFSWFGKAGNVPAEDLGKTLNMGIGMVVIVKPKNVELVTEMLQKEGEQVYKIGRLESGEQKCVLENLEKWVK